MAQPTNDPERVILHIGVNKTGSTALQTALRDNASLLLDRGFYYAPTQPEAWPNHNPLAAAFKFGNSSDVGERAVARLIEDARGRTLLVSSEMLCEPTTDVVRFLSCFRGRQVLVIAYLRHPCDIVVSAYDEIVRHGKTRHTAPINRKPLAYDPSQLSQLERWFGNSGVDVALAPYDRQQWPRGQLVADFMQMIGVNCDGLHMEERRINESLPFAATEKLRAFNETMPSEDEHAKFVEQLRAMPFEGAAYPLSRTTAMLCLRRMQTTLPILRPHFREGFDDGYLLEQRPWVRRTGMAGAWDRIRDWNFRRQVRAMRKSHSSQ